MKQTKIPYGYCQCGCGEKTLIPDRNHYTRGQVRGEPLRFIHGHHFRLAHNRSNGSGVGEKNPRWKGDAAGYRALHIWVNKHHPRLGYCAFCEKEGKTEYANISGEYRRDIEDFVELCKSCHGRFDAGS